MLIIINLDKLNYLDLQLGFLYYQYSENKMTKFGIIYLGLGLSKLIRLNDLILNLNFAIKNLWYCWLLYNSKIHFKTESMQ